LWKGGGKQHGKRAALGEAEDGGLPRPGGIHDCTDVRHLGLEVEKTIEGHWIGQACSPPVEDDQAPMEASRRRWRANSGNSQNAST
jgi:hypothetical protein